MMGMLTDSYGSWDPIVRTVPFIIGVWLLISTALSLMRTMVVPRALPSLMSALATRVTVNSFRVVARMSKTYAGRDRTLAWVGPMIILVSMGIWLLGFVFAYALMIYGISTESFGTCLAQAGSSLLTLGLLNNATNDQTFIDFLAAMTGPAVIALLIGFLPTMYTAYLAREKEVLLLAALAGSPAWGPELLSRSYLLGAEDQLDSIYRAWTQWVVNVRLTQTLYPALNHVRSPTATRHWLISLMAVMDAAALHTALTAKAPRTDITTILREGSEAIILLYNSELDQVGPGRYRRRVKGWLAKPGEERASRQAQHEIARIAAPSVPGLTPQIISVERAVISDNMAGVSKNFAHLVRHGDSQRITLTRSDFDHAVDILKASGMPIDKDLDQAWDEYSRERQRYEYTSYRLAQALYAAPAPWSGPRTPALPVLWPTLATDELPEAEQDSKTE